MKKKISEYLIYYLKYFYRFPFHLTQFHFLQPKEAHKELNDFDILQVVSVSSLVVYIVIVRKEDGNYRFIWKFCLLLTMSPFFLSQKM